MNLDVFDIMDFAPLLDFKDSLSPIVKFDPQPHGGCCDRLLGLLGLGGGRRSRDSRTEKPLTRYMDDV